MSLARLLARRGEQESAQRMLSAACAWFTEGFDTADLRAAAMVLQELAAPRERQQ